MSPPFCSYHYLPKFHQTKINILTFDHSGTLLASAAVDGTIHIWSLLSHRLVASCDLPAFATAVEWMQAPLGFSGDIQTGCHDLVIGLNDGTWAHLELDLGSNHSPGRISWSKYQNQHNYPISAVATSPTDPCVIICNGLIAGWWCFEGNSVAGAFKTIT